ncbi:STAS domain-containing protein [Catellatospora sichuanensis]|uniref:STAS domain-containing protein n=1 Tax=Catellatospora sichuanensis TaxID=1969805 RepID=UPI001C90A341|nr:STAS domain-containing protein [Catellatospora sichuanensis]
MRERGRESYAVLVLGPSLGAGDLAPLCAQVDDACRGMPAGGDLVVLCDVGALARPDLAGLDVLARLRLHTTRAGGSLRLWRAGPHLRLLLELTGLRSVLPSHPGSSADELGLLAPYEHGRQAEQREQLLGVEEVVDPGDPPG